MKIFKKFSFWLPIVFFILTLSDIIIARIIEASVSGYIFFIALLLDGMIKPPSNSGLQDMILIILFVLPIPILFLVGLLIDKIIHKLKKNNV